MRTTISISDDLFQAVTEVVGTRSFDEFAAEAIQARVLDLKRAGLARQMDEGYRFEAESPSLAAEWEAFEVEGLD